MRFGSSSSDGRARLPPRRKVTRAFQPVLQRAPGSNRPVSRSASRSCVSPCAIRSRRRWSPKVSSARDSAERHKMFPLQRAITIEIHRCGLHRSRQPSSHDENTHPARDDPREAPCGSRRRESRENQAWLVETRRLGQGRSDLRCCDAPRCPVSKVELASGDVRDPRYRSFFGHRPRQRRGADLSWQAQRIRGRAFHQHHHRRGSHARLAGAAGLKAKATDEIAVYGRMQHSTEMLAEWQILPLDHEALQNFERLRRARLKMSTLDMKIASVALAYRRHAALAEPARLPPGLRLESGKLARPLSTPFVARKAPRHSQTITPAAVSNRSRSPRAGAAASSRGW